MKPKGGIAGHRDRATSRSIAAYCKQHEEVQPGDYVEIAVTDTGCGIPAENIEKVFQPFFTTKEPEAGSGLGLSMTYGFVKQSGGHIKIYSEVGHGTTVKLYLPARRRRSPPSPRPRRRRQRWLPSSRGSLLSKPRPFASATQRGAQAGGPGRRGQ